MPCPKSCWPRTFELAKSKSDLDQLSCLWNSVRTGHSSCSDPNFLDGGLGESIGSKGSALLRPVPVNWDVILVEQEAKATEKSAVEEVLAADVRSVKHGCQLDLDSFLL